MFARLEWKASWAPLKFGLCLCLFSKIVTSALPSSATGGCPLVPSTQLSPPHWPKFIFSTLWSPFSNFLTFCLWFFLVFSLLHSASQKHSLNPMHESHLAHLKLSKVRVQIVCPPCVSDSQPFRGAGHTNSNTARMQSHTSDLISGHLSSAILTPVAVGLHCVSEGVAVFSLSFTR